MIEFRYQREYTWTLFTTLGMSLCYSVDAYAIQADFLKKCLLPSANLDRSRIRALAEDELDLPFSRVLLLFFPWPLFFASCLITWDFPRPFFSKGLSCSLHSSLAQTPSDHAITDSVSLSFPPSHPNPPRPVSKRNCVHDFRVVRIGLLLGQTAVVRHDERDRGNRKIP